MPAEPSMPRLVQEGVCPLSTRELIDRILLFVEEASGKKLYRYQRKLARRVIESLLRNDGATITALFSRQSGKSETIACLGIGLPLILPILANTFTADKRLRVFANGFKFGIFAPTNKHSGIIYMRIRDRVNGKRFKALLEDPEIDVQFTHSRGDSFSYSNGSEVQAFTASENVLNEGFTYHLIVTDESQKISSTKVNKELRPMLASYNGSIVEIGTAFMARCQFHDDIKKNVAVERETGVRNHFQFDFEQVVKDRRDMYNQDANSAHLAYEKFCTNEISRLGGMAAANDNESFRMNFKLCWEDAFTNALNMVKFKSLGRPDVELGAHFAGGRYVAGLDIGKDQDSTWLTVGWVDTAHPHVDMTQWVEDANTDEPAVYYNVTVVGWLVLQGNFESDRQNLGQYDAIIAYLRRFPRLDSLTVDATGKGDPVHERLAKLLPSVRVEPYNFSLVSKHNLYRWYFQEISAGRFRYAAGPETQETPEYKDFIDQHDGLVREFAGNYMKVFASDDENGHDDAPDSAALMLNASRNEGVPMIDFGSDGPSSENRVTEVDGGDRRTALAGRGASRYARRH